MSKTAQIAIAGAGAIAMGYEGAAPGSSSGPPWGRSWPNSSTPGANSTPIAPYSIARFKDQ